MHRRWYYANPEKVREIKERDREYRKDYYNSPARKERYRFLALKRTFGISKEEYTALLAEQNGRCAICGGGETSVRSKHLAVDHCHTSGVIRGLLCSTCNAGLGCFKDRPDLLSGAIHYLGRAK
jgi:hypothetical protein